MAGNTPKQFQKGYRPKSTPIAGHPPVNARPVAPPMIDAPKPTPRAPRAPAPPMMPAPPSGPPMGLGGPPPPMLAGPTPPFGARNPVPPQFLNKQATAAVPGPETPGQKAENVNTLAQVLKANNIDPQTAGKIVADFAAKDQ